MTEPVEHAAERQERARGGVAAHAPSPPEDGRVVPLFKRDLGGKARAAWVTEDHALYLHFKFTLRTLDDLPSPYLDALQELQQHGQRLAPGLGEVGRRARKTLETQTGHVRFVHRALGLAFRELCTKIHDALKDSVGFEALLELEEALQGLEKAARAAQDGAPEQAAAAEKRLQQAQANYHKVCFGVPGKAGAPAAAHTPAAAPPPAAPAKMPASRSAPWPPAPPPSPRDRDVGRPEAPLAETAQQATAAASTGSPPDSEALLADQDGGTIAEKPKEATVGEAEEGGEQNGEDISPGGRLPGPESSASAPPAETARADAPTAAPAEGRDAEDNGARETLQEPAVRTRAAGTAEKPLRAGARQAPESPPKQPVRTPAAEESHPPSLPPELTREFPALAELQEIVRETSHQRAHAQAYWPATVEFFKALELRLEVLHKKLLELTGSPEERQDRATAFTAQEARELVLALHYKLDPYLPPREGGKGVKPARPSECRPAGNHLGDHLQKTRKRLLGFAYQYGRYLPYLRTPGQLVGSHKVENVGTVSASAYGPGCIGEVVQTGYAQERDGQPLLVLFPAVVRVVLR